MEIRRSKFFLDWWKVKYVELVKKFEFFKLDRFLRGENISVYYVKVVWSDIDMNNYVIWSAYVRYVKDVVYYVVRIGFLLDFEENLGKGISKI